MLKVRRAVIEDIPNIMQFMDEHWKPGNILAKDRNFFEWQFVDGDKVNMFIGIDEEEGKIYGMIGAIVYSKSEHPDISGCTWQTIKSSNPMLGMELMECMYTHICPRYVYSLGLTKKAARINSFLGMQPVIMDHYYRLADRDNYYIAKVINKDIPKVGKTGYTLDKVDSVDEMKMVITEETLRHQVLSKDYTYVQKRYFEHPVYVYDVWRICNDKKVAVAILITREEVIKSSKILKIIDYYGGIKHLGMITEALDQLMIEKEYEFADIYSYGVPTELYEKAGLLKCDKKSENIIPNYFHPFVQENIDLLTLEPVVEGTKLFRGDGDQDRPC